MLASSLKQAIGYKIVTRVNWTSFIESKKTECYGFDNDLTDGFIHLSTRDQIINTFNNKYRTTSTDKDQYNLLAIDLAHNPDIIKYERAKNGLLYPHLMGTINDKNLLWSLSLSHGLERVSANF